eukprot:TRINITY_DN28918_c0_g1_i1.p1 TRINITY_DN28918_c0_g1~~TRINITY_DN28918_c0_g1_i1.p1  ORF type:complete len:478 (-),score=53.08 TRINITY_DN28918_c0_g1_i1:149-1582(-)
MPDLILEVLSLQLRAQNVDQDTMAWLQGLDPESDFEAHLCGSGWQFRPQGQRWISARCELAPAWDNTSLCFATQAAPVDASGESATIWPQQAAPPLEDIGHRENSDKQDPLMAVLVSVPPPGGVAHIASQCLNVTMFLSCVQALEAQAPSEPIDGQDNDSTQEVECPPSPSGNRRSAEVEIRVDVPLRPIGRQGIGEVTAVAAWVPWRPLPWPGYRLPLCKQDHGGYLYVAAQVAWLPAPRGLRSLAPEPSAIAQAQLAATQRELLPPSPARSCFANWPSSSASHRPRPQQRPVAASETPRLTARLGHRQRPQSAPRCQQQSSSSRCPNGGSARAVSFDIPEEQQEELQRRSAELAGWNLVLATAQHRLDAARWRGDKETAERLRKILKQPPPEVTNPVRDGPQHTQQRLMQRAPQRPSARQNTPVRARLDPRGNHFNVKDLLAGRDVNSSQYQEEREIVGRLLDTLLEDRPRSSGT